MSGQPQTEAGRRFMAEPENEIWVELQHADMLRVVLAIEQEATAAARAEAQDDIARLTRLYDAWTLKRAANTLRDAFNRMPDPPKKTADAEAYRAGWLAALRASADELERAAYEEAHANEATK